MLENSSKKAESRLEKATRKLYNPTEKLEEKPRAEMHADHETVPEDWSHSDTSQPMSEPLKKKSSPLLKKVFYGALAFCVVALGFAAISLSGSRGSISNNNIDLNISGKAFADGGEQLEIQVEITNKNTAPLELADLILKYAKASTGEQSDEERLRESLGTIKAHDTVTRTFPVTLFGEEGEERTIVARLEYRVQGSNAIFVKENSFPITLRSTPVQLLFEVPDKAVQNQILPLEVTVESNSTTLVPNMMVRLEYPPGYEFTESEPEPTLGNNIWVLGDLAPGAERKISVSGIMKAEQDEQRTFRAFVGAQDERDERKLATTFNSVSRIVTLNRPFLGASISLQGETTPTVAVNSRSTVKGRIDFNNTLPSQIRDLEVTLKFSGSAYDKNAVSGRQGFFDSATNEIKWTKSTYPKLALFESGQEDTLEFSFVPKALVSGSDSVIAKPEVIVEVSVRGITSDGTVRSAEDVDRKVAIINTDLRLDTKTLFYGGPFTNSGPMPPKVGKATTYTIGWAVTNSSNSIANAKVTTSLPTYVTWLGSTSPTTENITYNSVTHEITWNLGTVAKGTGFSTKAREAFFKVSITPSSSQLGAIPDLTGEVILSGEDTFSTSLLRQIRNPHTIHLLNDISSAGGNGQVGA